MHVTISALCSPSSRLRNVLFIFLTSFVSAAHWLVPLFETCHNACLLPCFKSLLACALFVIRFKPVLCAWLKCRSLHLPAASYDCVPASISRQSTAVGYLDGSNAPFNNSPCDRLNQLANTIHAYRFMRSTSSTTMLILYVTAL